MVSISINGVSINCSGDVSGRSIVVANGRVLVNGQDVTPDAKDIRIEVHGNVESLEVDACSSLRIQGNVGEVSTQSGDVTCGNVAGSVQTMSGDVACGVVGGAVRTMSGDITHMTQR